MARHSAVYVVGTALQGLGVLIILPFATRLLGPAEFGRVAAGLVVVQMVGTLASAGLPQVILREHNRGADGPRAARALAGAMILVALVLGVVGALAVLGLGRGGMVGLQRRAAARRGGGGPHGRRVRSDAHACPAAALVVPRPRRGFDGRWRRARDLVVARTSPTASTYLTAYAVVLALVAAVAVVLGRPLLPTAAARARARGRAAGRCPCCRRDLPCSASSWATCCSRAACSVRRQPAATRSRCSWATCRSSSRPPCSTRGLRWSSRSPGVTVGVHGPHRHRHDGRRGGGCSGGRVARRPGSSCSCRRRTSTTSRWLRRSVGSSRPRSST